MLPSNATSPRFSSVKTLLNGLFDYAGMFPPASLPLENALEEYLGHRSEPDAWMVGPFVVPVGKLIELNTLLADRALHTPLSFIVLPRSAASGSESLDLWAEDLAACTEFLVQANGNAVIESFEFRFPVGLFNDPELAARFAAQTAALFSGAGFEEATLFGEIVRTESFLSELPIYFLTLASAQRMPRMLGKIRCGGMDTKAFPSPLELAHFIHTAIRVAHPFKATAGLHHPVRFLNTEQGVRMHGFLNVFFAVTLGRVHDLKPSDIQEIIEEENPVSFEFTSSGIKWKNLTATNTDFIHDRRMLGLSIGSCSFDEPRADLIGLGWLSETTSPPNRS